jgi:membrane protein
MTERLDRFQRRHRWAGFPLAVFYKFFDDSGSYLAALITYYAFVSLFPILLLMSTILAFVLAGNPHLQHQIVQSALSDFPVIGSQLGQPKQLGGGVGGLIVGILGALYGGLGVAQATQYAMNTAWTVPRNKRPNPLKARGRSLVLLLTAGLSVLGTTVLSALAGSTGPLFGKILLVAGSVIVNALVFLLVFRIGTTRPLSWRDIAPGAIGAAVGWQLLQSFGVVYVQHVVRHASATNGVFALVLGLLAFLYLTAVIVVFCIEVNVVRVDRLHPRSLLTPFTDNVHLTQGDERSYTDQAQAQRLKGFEQVDVKFHDRRPR